MHFFIVIYVVSLHWTVCFSNRAQSQPIQFHTQVCVCIRQLTSTTGRKW